MSAVVIVCEPGSEIPLWKIAGLTLLERAIRMQKREHETVYVRGDAQQLAYVRARGLPALPEPDNVGASAQSISAADVAGVAVIDEPSRKKAEWALLQSCRRPNDCVGDRFFIRSFSLRITKLLCRVPITPTQVTLLNAISGIVAVLLVARGDRLGYWLGGFGIILSVILDSVDGELARVTMRTSRLGMTIDNVSDDIIDNGFVAALGFALGGIWAWIGATVAVLRWISAGITYWIVWKEGHPGDVMAFRWWYETSGASSASQQPKASDYSSPAVWIRSLGRRGTYCLLWGFLCWLGLPAVAFGYGAVMCSAYLVVMIVHCVVMSRRKTEKAMLTKGQV